MSEMNRLEWWIIHLPLCLQDTTTENAQDLIQAWQTTARMPGGIQSLAETGNSFDLWLEAYGDRVRPERETEPSDEDIAITLDDSIHQGVAYEAPVVRSVFELCIDLAERTGMDSGVIQAIRTLLVGLKKWKHDIDLGHSERDLDDVAKRGYIDRIRNLSHCKVAPRLVPIAKSILAELFQDWDEQLINCNPRTGPGSVVEGLNPLAKWRLLGTVYHGYHFSCLCSWNDADGLPRSWGESPYERLLSARLQAVPKDAWKRRLITVEPLTHGFAQQLCRSAMIQCCARYSATSHLHLESVRVDEEGTYDGQLSQQRRALHGSRGMSVDSQWSNQQWCTLDLTDASDYVSAEQVKDLFPANVVNSLFACRSFYINSGGLSKDVAFKDIAFDGTGEGDLIVQRSYAGMGNATTFIVQTLMFWVILESLRRYMALPGQVHVYGDDIIIQANLIHHADALGLFASLGWKVNTTKSYYRRDGRFRESCGVQAFNGHPVTVERFKGYDENDCLDCIALGRKITRVAEMWPTLAQRMLSTAVRISNYQGAPKGSIDVDCWNLERTSHKPPMRYNRKLCRLEVQTWTVTPETVTDWSARIGYVFASLLGFSLTRWREVKRRRANSPRPVKVRVPYYLAPVPKRVVQTLRWIPSTEWGRVDERG